MTERASLGPGFVKLWTASVVSNLGDGVDVAALPLLAATLTRDPATFAGVTLASRLPWLVVALPAGVLIDRTDRRQLIGLVNVVRGALIGGLGLAVLFDEASIPLLYVVAALLGTGEVLADVAFQVVLPSVVRSEHLERANGRLFAAEIATNQFVGPPLGGLLFAAAAASPMLVDSATFVVGSLLVLSLRGSFRPARREEPPVGVRGEIVAGIRWLWRHRLLRTLALLGAVLNGVWTAGFSVLALFALEVLGVGDVGFGVLLGVSGVGYVLGSLGSPRLLGLVPRVVTLVSASLSLLLVTLAIATTSSPTIIGAALFTFGFLSAGWDVVAVTLRQRATPDHLFGRVNSAYRFIQWGSMPLGALLGGALADSFGLRAPWATGAVLIGVATLAAIPTLRASTSPEDRISRT